MTLPSKKVLIIGAGLAGSEAAHYLASAGVEVVLVESKRVAKTEAQKSEFAAELVCTNSLKSSDPATAHGLLKLEMEHFGSLILKSAKEESVPAGAALAVDRELFSKRIDQVLRSHPKITFVDALVDDPWAFAKKYECSEIIIASGPLTHLPLTKWMEEHLAYKKEDLFFYDAIAPVVDADSLDMSKLYFKDRHSDEVEADYLNAPMNKTEYLNFVSEIVKAEKVRPKNFEEEIFFESCLPVDIMAQRGVETLRFSCMKPIGLEQREGQRPYAVVQLRKENRLGSAYNLVGFQNRLTYGEQVRVFRMIPGLEQAQFFHLGSVHRNTFIHSAKLCNVAFESKTVPSLYFAGQITGVEGYTESAASGIYVAFQLLRKLQGKEYVTFPPTTCLGALMQYVLTATKPIPSNINMGLFPPIPEMVKPPRGVDRKKYKKDLYVQRAQEDFSNFLKGL